MSFVSKLFYKIKKTIAIKRRKVVRHYSLDNDFSIISCNCIGGILYHDLGKEFLSPTINLFIESPDFIKFCSNLSGYLNETLEYDENSKEYPIGILGDIKIHFLHYKNFSEAKSAWSRRSTRVLFNNIFVIMSDRDNYSAELFEDFKRLKYKKVLFSHTNIADPDVVYVEKDRKKNMVDDLTKFYDLSGERVYEHYFDFEKWLTGNYQTGECKRR